MRIHTVCVGAATGSLRHSACCLCHSHAKTGRQPADCSAITSLLPHSHPLTASDPLSSARALQQGDFFSLHMPLLPTTKNMFNDELFAKIKKGARIINVARGGVIDEAALARALDAGQVGAKRFNVHHPT